MEFTQNHIFSRFQVLNEVTRNSIRNGGIVGYRGQLSCPTENEIASSQAGHRLYELLKAPQTHLRCEDSVMGWSHGLLLQEQEGRTRYICAVCGDIRKEIYGQERHFLREVVLRHVRMLTTVVQQGEKAEAEPGS